jgi:hypothetical protein
MNEANGLVLSYSDARLESPSLPAITDRAYLCAFVRCRLTVFTPRLAAKLVGRITAVQSDRVAVSVLGILYAGVRISESSQYQYDANQLCWTHPTRAPLTAGALIRFSVVGIEHSKNQVDIDGSVFDDFDGAISGELPQFADAFAFAQPDTHHSMAPAPKFARNAAADSSDEVATLRAEYEALNGLMRPEGRSVKQWKKEIGRKRREMRERLAAKDEEADGEKRSLDDAGGDNGDADSTLQPAKKARAQ